MPKVPLIRQYVFEQVTSTLENMNANVERALAKQGIPDWRYLDGNDVVPLVHFIEALEAGSRATGDEKFSMRVSEEHGLDSFGEFGAAIQSGITVYDAMSIACRLINTQVPTLKWWTEKRKGGYLLCRAQSVRSPDHEQALTYLERYTMLLLLNVIRTGAGPNWSPPQAYLSQQKKDILGNWEAFADASIEFEAPCSAIFVPNSVVIKPLLDRPIPNIRKASVLDNQMLRDDLGKDFAHDVLLVIQSLIRQKSADLNTLSEATMMSRRTLQRELSKHGQSFSKILNQARFQLAVEFLDQADANVTEISEKLGYEHPQHFIRAFQRWAGVTPGLYQNLQKPKM